MATKKVDSGEALFEKLVATLSKDERVDAPSLGAKGFGSSALKAGGKIFAMYVRGKLVVKLPAARVTSLVSAKKASPFDANKGKPMKEWAAISVDERKAWAPLAKEALEFVTS